LETISCSLVEDAGFGALLHQHLDLVVGHRRLFLAARAEQAQDGCRGTGQHDDQRMGHFGQEHHRAGDERCDPFRRQHRQALGHQFADHDGEIGQCDNGNGQCHALGVRCQQRHAGQPGGQGIGQRGFADGAAENANRGDADLDGR
jgi:hypothetical protein